MSHHCSMIRVALTALGMCVVSTFCGWIAMAETSVSSSAVKAAEQALETYKGFIPWEQMGFSSHQELLDATVEEGIPVYSLDLKAVARDTDTLADKIRDTKMVEFLVASNGRPISRLTVRQVDSGEYKRVAFGLPGDNLWLGLSALPTQSGAKLVRLGPAEFLYLDHEGTEYLVSINPYPLSGIESFKPYTFKDIQPTLQKFALGMLESSPDESGGLGVSADGPAPPPPALWALTAIGTLLVLGSARTIRRIARR